MSKKVASKFRQTEEKFGPNDVVLQRDEAAKKAKPRSQQQDQQFATGGLARKPTEKDRLREFKRQLIGKDGVSKLGVVKAKDEDFKYLMKLQALEEKAQFQQWFSSNYDLMSPADKKRARELYPQYYKERMRVLKQQAKNAQRLAKIKLNGVESREDLKLQYLAETGRLNLGPLQSILNPIEQADATRALAFQRGMLNPLRLFGMPAARFTNKQESETFSPQNANLAWDPRGLPQGTWPLSSRNYTGTLNLGSKELADRLGYDNTPAVKAETN